MLRSYGAVHGENRLDGMHVCHVIIGLSGLSFGKLRDKSRKILKYCLGQI